MSIPIGGGLQWDAATLGGINVALWLLSLVLGKTWPVDFIWSGFPALQCLLVIVRHPGGGVCERRVVGCALIATWGFRLTQNFVARGGIGHEDWRYTDMRAKFGRHFWWISFFSVFLGQTIFLFGGCLSVYGILLSPQQLGATDAVGAVVCCTAILLETAADIQMDAFLAARREHKTDATVINRGLWMWSRHPNYLGELSWWWGLYALSVPSGSPVWVVAGPVLMTLLFVCISIKLMEDRQRQKKGDEWVAYTRVVPSPLLLLPPALNRWLGRLLHGPA